MSNGTTVVLQDHIQIEVDGAQLSDAVARRLHRMEIDLSLAMPSQTILDFHDPDNQLIDGTTFEVGKALTIKLKNRDSSARLTQVFRGEIIGLQPEFDFQENRLIVIAYDKSHRLTRGTKSRTFMQQTDSTIIRRIAEEAGLTAEITATNVQNEFLYQDNVSDYDFIRHLAHRNNLMVYCEDDKLLVKPPMSDGSAPTITYGRELMYFRPRANSAEPVTKVTGQWWDMKNKRQIVTQANTGAIAHGDIPAGKDLVPSKLNISPEKVVVSAEIRVPDMAVPIAKSEFVRNQSETVVAEGRMMGDMRIKPNTLIKIDKLGTRFSGNYLVTGAKHIYGDGSGYEVEFTVEGMSPKTLHSLISGEEASQQTWPGVYPAIVTNVKDPEYLGRVKVKFPWLSDQLETDWVRIATDAGLSRGMLSLPETSDEVLVAFEQGLFSFPYIVGGLWNGRDKPPVNDYYGEDGKIAKRLWQSRTGHSILLHETSQESNITITEAKEGYILKLDGQNQKLEFSDGDSNKIVIDLRNRNLTIETVNDMVIKGKNIDITATDNFTVTAARQVKVSASMVKIN